MKLFRWSMFLFLLTATSVFGATLTFQEGDGGSYSTTDAAFIEQGFPNVNHGIDADLWALDQSGINIRTLIQFSDIFGSNTGQIAYGTSIISATLGIRTTSNATSGLNYLYRVTTDWNESTVTWTSFGNSYNGTVMQAFSPSLGETVYNLDITSLVQDWSDQTYANQGVLIRNTINDVVIYYSDDATEFSYRPLLTINYVSPVPEPMSVVLLGIGLIGLLKRKFKK